MLQNFIETVTTEIKYCNQDQQSEMETNIKLFLTVASQTLVGATMA